MTRSNPDQPIKPWQPKGPPRSEFRRERVLISRRDAVFGLRLLLAIQGLEESNSDDQAVEFHQFDANKIRRALENKLFLHIHARDGLQMGFITDETRAEENKRVKFDDVDVEIGRRLWTLLYGLETSGAESDPVDLKLLVSGLDLGQHARTILKAVQDGEITIYDVRREV